MSQLSLNFPKADTKSISIKRVFDRMEYEENLEFLKRVRTPSNKTIRLAKDMAKQCAPLMFDFHDMVRSILQSNVSDDRINRVKSFKTILYKTVITDVRCLNGKYIIETKRVRRR